MTAETPLERSPAGMYCPLCGGHGTPAGEYDNFPVRRCERGHAPVLLAWPWDSAEDYERQYHSPEGDYHHEEMRRTGRRPFVNRDAEYLATAAARLWILSLLYPATRFPRLLDIGSGNGCLVAQAPVFHYEATGIEPCPVMSTLALKLGRKVVPGTWQHSLTEGSYWHLITLYDVLEHLVSPLECLRHLRRALMPEGVLVVEMPEYLAPGDWERHVKPKEHPFLLSAGAAEEMFRSCGFRWDLIYRPGQGTLGKIAYFLRRED